MSEEFITKVQITDNRRHRTVGVEDHYFYDDDEYGDEEFY